MQTVLNVAFNQSNLVPLNKKNHCRRIKHICFWSIVKNETLRQQRSIQFSHCEFISSNIPTSPVYGVYISQLIRYSRACCSYHDFLDRELLPTKKLLKPGFLVVKLKSWLRKRVFYERQNLFLLLEQLGLPPVFGGVHIAHLFSFLCCVFGFVCLRSLSCASNVAGFSGLSFLDFSCGFNFSYVYSVDKILSYVISFDLFYILWAIVYFL
jgi:hypothetical protein